MDEGLILEKLCMFGLTRQEAALYLCLAGGGEMSGYEAAKQTGISRSNAYGGLAGLVEKGAAFVIEGETSKYTAVPIAEFCSNKIRTLEQEKEFLVTGIKASHKQGEGYVTITGYRHICDKIRNMLESAEQRVYLSAPVSLIRLLHQDLQGVAEKQIKVVLITDGEMNLEGITRYHSGRKETQLRLIIDSAFVLTGEITQSPQDTCLYTGQKNFVNVFKEALKNEIKLIALEGERFRGGKNE